jgi:hypothetical protein
MVSSLKWIAPCGQGSPGDFHPGSAPPYIHVYGQREM